MGITADNFFENIYSVIFSPKEFFENKEIKISLRLALFNVLFIALFSKISSGILYGNIFNMKFLFGVISSLFFSVVFWFLTGVFFEYIAKIFARDAGFSKILFYTSFAPIPYIFFAPLNLFKQAGSYFYTIASLTELILFIWIIFLYAYSLKAVYNISLSRAFMIIFLPFFSVLFVIYWLVCFFSAFKYIFSI